MPRVSDVHLAARREQILVAAMARFADGGFHSTGMAEVIAASGMSAGAVYRYFTSKEQLIRAIVEERVLAPAAVAFEHVLDEGVDDMAEAVVAAIGIVDRIGAQDGVDLTRIAVQAWGESLRNPDVRDLVQEAYGTIRGYLAAVARRANQTRTPAARTTPEEQAQVAFSVIMGYLLQRLVMNDTASDRYANAVRDLMGRP